MSKSFADVMASDKVGPSRVTEWVCFSPTLSAEWSALQLEYVQEKENEQARAAVRDPEKPTPSGRLADKSKSVKILQKMETLLNDNDDVFYEVVFERADPKEWARLKIAHPPRDEVAADAGLYNVESFGQPAVALCMVDPEPDPEKLAFFQNTLTSGEWQRLARIVWNLNEGVRSVPKVEWISLLLGGSQTE